MRKLCVGLLFVCLTIAVLVISYFIRWEASAVAQLNTTPAPQQGVKDEGPCCGPGGGKDTEEKLDADRGPCCGPGGGKDTEEKPTIVDK